MSGFEPSLRLTLQRTARQIRRARPARARWGAAHFRVWEIAYASQVYCPMHSRLGGVARGGRPGGLVDYFLEAMGAGAKPEYLEQAFVRWRGDGAL